MRPCAVVKPEAKLAETNEDINHLKDQITTLEVNMARVFNYNVKAKRTGDEPADGDAKRIDAGLLG